MSLDLEVLQKAVIRIEKKLDELLKIVVPMAQKQAGSAIPPMPLPLNVPNQGVCPLCQSQIIYVSQPNVTDGGITLRRLCNCEPMAVSLDQGEGA
jgi:hypothetical protein